MRSCHKCLLSLSTVLLINHVIVARPALAQNTQAPTESLEAITIIGSDPTRTGDVIADEQSVSTSRITREELTRTPNALAEVIARESGVQFQQSGGFGSFTSVSIRAASAAQTGVFLNGILLNTGGNPVIDLSTLEVLNLGSVNIYRGSTPLQLGHAGIGGAINLQTLDGGSTPRTSIRLGVGSFSDRSVQASHQNAKGPWEFVSALSYRESENDFRFTNDNTTPLNPNDDERQSRNNAQARRASVLLQAEYQHNEDARTGLTLQAADKSLGVPQSRNSPNNSATFDTLSTQLQLTHIRDGIKNWNTKHSLYWHIDDSHFQDLQAQIGLGADDRRNDNYTLGAKTYWEYPTSTGFTALSLDFRSENLDSSDPLGSINDYTAERQEWLAALHYTWFDASDKWTVTPALRWQHDTRTGNRQRNGEPATQRDDSNQAGVQLGISYKLNRKTQLSMNLGTFYRTPSFGELFGAIGLINGNDELDPEEGINADLGISWNTDILALASTLFVSDKESLIVTSFDSRGVGRPVNSGEAFVYGIELSAKWSFNRYWDVRSNMTWQSPKSVDRNSGFDGKFLPGEAQLVWFTRASYTRSEWSYWYEADVQRNSFFDRANILPAEDYTQHSVGIGWRKARWSTNMSIQNLSDTNVEDFNGFPKPGRHWSLNVTRTL